VSSSLDELQRTFEIDLHWHSFELRPPGSPPMPEAYRQRIEAMRPRMEQMAQEVYGVQMKHGPMGVNSRPALIGMQYAQDQGKGAAYHDAVFRAYWQDERDIGDRAVLLALAESVGLERTAFEAALDDPAWEEAMLNDVEQAHAIGISGVPALIFEQKYLVSGAQPYDALVNVVEQVRQRQTQA
jgi:predicted DsbA family dithiol-disulfide isomerase